MIEYKKYQSPQWKEISRQIRIRDGGVCQDCGRRVWGADSHVHHIDGDRNNNHPDNLILLCPQCHSARHGRYLHVRNNSPSITLYDYP